MARNAAEFVQFKLRVSEKLRRDIEREAKKNHRSANAEAVERLEKSFETSAVRQWDAWNTFITMMIGGGESADFLRWLAPQMRDTNWSDAGSRELMIEKIKDKLEAQ
jgi:Arc-like DNA binding domain